MNGVSLSTGSQLAAPGLGTTALPIISTQNQGLVQFSEHIPRTVEVRAPTMDRKDRKLRHIKRFLRRARRNRSANGPCRMYAGVGSFLRIHHNGTVDGDFNTNPSDLSIIQFMGLATAIGLVRIKGQVSKNYLCMNRHGMLYGSRNFSDECIFKEHIEENNYNYYSSHKYKKNDRRRRGKGTNFWFVALNKNGTSRPAHRSGMHHVFTKFLLHDCKKMVTNPGPFTPDNFNPQPQFKGKIKAEDVLGNNDDDKKTEKQKGKGKGKKKRCKGRRRNCRKDKKGKGEKKAKKDQKDKRKDGQDPNKKETICKRRWRNRKLRKDYVDEKKAIKRRKRCQKRLQKERKAARQAKKQAMEVDTPSTSTATPEPTTTTMKHTSTSTNRPTTRIEQSLPPTTTTSRSLESLPSTTPHAQSDLKSNRFSAATDFRSVFENLIKVIETNNKEMRSNFSSVNGGGFSLASMLRSGRMGQASGASFRVEHKHRHHHGSDDRRRNERALTDSKNKEGAEDPSNSNSDLQKDTQSSETGLKSDPAASDSVMDAGSKPSVTSQTIPAKRVKPSQFELLMKALSKLEGQNSDNFRTGVLVVGNGPFGRWKSRRRRLRKRRRN